MIALSAVTAAAFGASGCSRHGTVGLNPAGTVAGPIQDLDLSGDPGLHWTASENPAGPLTPPPPSGAVTGCYSYADPATGAPVWAARITGGAGGHLLELDLEVDGQDNPPLGTHPTAGGHGLSKAKLAVDGALYAEVHIDPADAMPSYFTVEGEGTTGLVSIRFAAVPGGAQAFEVQGRWRCT